MSALIKIKAAAKNYLSVTKKEWNGTLVLVAFIALILALPYVYQWLRKDSTINFEQIENTLARRQQTHNRTIIGSGIREPRTLFDPNTLTDAQWKSFGLTGRQVLVIRHYQQKGGRFYRKEDVKKMYTISADVYKRIEPYIKIDKSAIRRPAPAVIIDLNRADSIQLLKIYGVGPAFAHRILSYRNRLGGFYSKQQLKEVYGLDAAKYDEIKDQVSVDGKRIKRVNINTAAFDDLKRFPYLSYKQINAIVAYRDEHGSYTSVADMRNIAILNDGILRKIEPYLLFK